jgi:hypothetical protein
MAANVIITYAHRDDMDSMFVSCLQAMVNYDSREGGGHILDVLDVRSGPMLPAARNGLVETALGYEDCEWILMLDDDMGFDNDTVEKFMKVVDPERGISVVGGLAFCGGRSGQVTPTLKRLNSDTGSLDTVWNFEHDTLEPIDATGAACLMVHRGVYEMVTAHFDRPYDWAKFNGEEVGEDIQFCLRMRSLKIPIYVHTGIQFSHWKKQPIDMTTYLAYRREITDLGEDEAREKHLRRLHAPGRISTYG